MTKKGGIINDQEKGRDRKTGRAVYEHQKRRGKGNGYYSDICLCRGEDGREEGESTGTDGQGGGIGLEEGGGGEECLYQEKIKRYIA